MIWLEILSGPGGRSPVIQDKGFSEAFYSECFQFLLTSRVCRIAQNWF